MDKKEKETKRKILKELISNMHQLMGEDLKCSKDKREEPEEEDVEIEVISLSDEESEEEEMDMDLSEEEKERIIKEYLKSKKE